MLGSRSTRAVTQVGDDSDPSADDGAVPLSGGLVAGAVPSLFHRLALSLVIVRRAASLLASLAGLRHGSVPMRYGQEGHLTAVQSATSIS